MADEMIRLLLDPGHGGPNDRANRGKNGYVEADGALTLSKYLRDELSPTKRFEIKLTRESDVGVTVKERGQMAADFKADLAISEHTNAGGGKAKGTEVYESVDLPDEELAAKMSKAISEVIGTKDRGAKYKESEKYPGEDYYGFIDLAQDGGCKHVLLVENAFHDNLEDEAFLLVDANLKKIAVAQAKVICELFGVTYPVAAATTDTTIKHSIVGTQEATADQLYAFANNANKNPKLTTKLYELCGFYLTEGKAEGIRGDIAFCQACKETGYFAFTGIAQPEWNNFCGLGVTGAKGVGNQFKDAQTGVRAHIQHLKAYASKDTLNQECVDVRFKYVSRGIAPSWEDLDGRWAVPGKNYGEDIYSMFEKALSYPDVDSTIDKGSLPRTETTTTTESTPATTESSEEKVNVGLVNKVLQLAFELLSKLIKK
jgi:N-acetylmuramoyl-L-alanine amidase